MESQLTAQMAPYQGKVSVYAVDLNSGKSVAIDADTPVPTASVIKLTVLFEALKQIEAGQARFDDRLTMQKADQVEGSGVLRFFDTPMNLTLKDALTMMVIVSDNTGTNLAIDHLGLANIDQRIEWMGLKNTWLYKKVFTPPSGPVPADQKAFGLGKTTAREMAEVMTRFAKCDLDTPGLQSPIAQFSPTPQAQALCKAALRMLESQQDRAGIPRYLDAEGVRIANKTGALDAVRNDVAIVYAKNGPIVISIFTRDNKDQSWSVDNAPQVLIANLAKLIVDDWK